MQKRRNVCDPLLARSVMGVWQLHHAFSVRLLTLPSACEEGWIEEEIDYRFNFSHILIYMYVILSVIFSCISMHAATEE